MAAKTLFYALSLLLSGAYSWEFNHYLSQVRNSETCFKPSQKQAKVKITEGRQKKHSPTSKSRQLP
jgi:hypothetical protein